MNTIPLKQSNEKSTTIHTFEETETCYPFAILEENEVNEKGETTTTFQPVLGNTKVTNETFENLVDVTNYIESKPYNLIFALICHCMEMKDNFEKEQQQLKKQSHETNKKILGKNDRPAKSKN